MMNFIYMFICLFQVIVDDTANYTCKASVEGLDSDEATAELTVKDRPDPPSRVDLKTCGAR